MAGTNPKVEIVVACAYGDVGTVLHPNGVLRDCLVGNGYAKVVEAEAPERPARMARKALEKLGLGK